MYKYTIIKFPKIIWTNLIKLAIVLITVHYKCYRSFYVLKIF